MGMGYEIKRHTPFEAVQVRMQRATTPPRPAQPQDGLTERLSPAQVVLIVIGCFVTLAQLAALLSMFLVRALLYAYAALEGVSFLASLIVVICVNLREVRRSGAAVLYSPRLLAALACSPDALRRNASGLLCAALTRPPRRTTC